MDSPVMNGPMTLEELEEHTAAGQVDTVIVAFPDQFGRLMGKRFTATHFLDHPDESESCNYILTTDIEMEPLAGFSSAGWELGYGDNRMKTDLETLRMIPWTPGTALALADLQGPEGKPVDENPRTILRKQIERLASGNFSARFASELEFFLYDAPTTEGRPPADSPEGFRNPSEGISPSTAFGIDYQIETTHGDEPFLRQVRNLVNGAGIPVESSKGETGRGQYEVTIAHAPTLEAADRHVLFKYAVKAIAGDAGRSVTFMAKPYDSDSGSSGHIHLSLWDSSGKGNRFTGETDEFRHFLGGLVTLTPELFLSFAPTINSYKRFRAGSFAPLRVGWGYDNRTVAYRVVGTDGSFRIENRLPGADMNPYLAYAAMVGAGMYGIERKIEPPSPVAGNAYTAVDLPGVPLSLGEAADRMEDSTVAREILGDGVTDHYVRHARYEVEAYRRHVSEWERRRYFSRI